MSQKVIMFQIVPPSTFSIFCNKLDLKKSKGPPFTILKTLLLLSLRYSADFRRSRLVYPTFGVFGVFNEHIIQI